MDLVNLRLLRTAQRIVLARGQLGALEDMRKEGKLDLIGISNVEHRRSRRRSTSSTSPGSRTPTASSTAAMRTLLEFARERDIAFVPFFPLGSAFTGGPQQLAAEPGDRRGRATSTGPRRPRSLSAWLLARYERMLLIPGTSSVAHLEENMAAIEIELDEADRAALDRVGQGTG